MGMSNSPEGQAVYARLPLGGYAEEGSSGGDDADHSRVVSRDRELAGGAGAVAVAAAAVEGVVR